MHDLLPVCSAAGAPCACILLPISRTICSPSGQPGGVPGSGKYGPHGPSQGKTELVKSLFRTFLELKIGDLEHFPAAMRKFSRRKHEGIVLDDVRDLAFLARHQHVLQGKYDAMVEFASTPGNTCAFEKYLYKVPFAVTINKSTKNLDYLEEHDFLGKAANRVLFHLTESPFEEPEEDSGAPLPLAPM